LALLVYCIALGDAILRPILALGGVVAGKRKRKAKPKRFDLFGALLDCSVADLTLYRPAMLESAHGLATEVAAKIEAELARRVAPRWAHLTHGSEESDGGVIRTAQPSRPSATVIAFPAVALKKCR
jgi:hypothetical protein